MKIVSLLSTIIVLFSCNGGRVLLPKTYSNKSQYLLEVGDTLCIYFTTNSCCSYCSPNATQLNNLRYIGRKLIVPEPEGCMGCNHTTALRFVAEKPGTDTLLGGMNFPMATCTDTVEGLKKFFIRVK